MMVKSWTIGSKPGCELLIEQPKVSGRHCRLTLEGGTHFLEDLRSTNGTYVNGRRIAEKTAVSRGDSITLGLLVPMPWPDDESPAGAVVLRIGREPDNDLVLRLPTVSGHHARIVWEGRPGEATIEDLGSANGTAIGEPDRKIQCAALAATDLVYFGTHSIPASYLLARLDRTVAAGLTLEGEAVVIGRDRGCDRVIDLPQVSGRHARIVRDGEGLSVSVGK
jgi:pSer/pThr/pTyr-binding forkhead associated (FHA) protein